MLISLSILPEIKSIRKREDQNYSEALTESLDRIRRIALPSVLESLQYGFERKKEVKKANLEDVFIQLTGKEWRQD